MKEFWFSTTLFVVWIVYSLSCVRAEDVDKGKAEMVTRIFRVNPGFVSKKPRMSSEETLKRAGIPFPPGAKVITLGAATGQLIVKNTEANLMLVDAYIRKCNTQHSK